MSGCPTFEGVTPSLMKAPLTIFGETHGTAEAPAFVAAFVCGHVRAGHPVVVILEIPAVEQEAFDRYLAGSGSPGDTRRLLNGAFWHRDLQDGRSSVAMLALVERVRALRASGTRLSILAMDGWSDDATRDANMAARVRASLAAHPEAMHVVLVGNVHASKVRGARFDPDYEPLGYLLRDRDPVSLDLRSDGGTAWICTGPSAQEFTCGVKVRSTTVSTARGIGIALDATEETRFDGTYYVGRVTASPPAVTER